MEETGARGERPRLLLVGGNGSTPARFARTWPYLEERFRPVVVEVAGQGNRSRVRQPYTFGGFADDLAGELARAAAGEPFLCYGQGIGGLLLAHALRRAPGLASRLILHAPVGAHLAQRRFPSLMAWAPVRALARCLLGSPLLGPRLADSLFEPGGAVTRADRRAFAAGYRQASSFGALFALTDPLEALDGLEELCLPVTMLWGGRDRVLRPEQLPAWAEALPAAPVTARLVPHWRHYPYLDRPAEFAAALAECAADRLPEEPVTLDDLTLFRPRTKAGRLASMRRAGLPVPPGWWIPAAALENGSAAALFAALPPDRRYAARSSSMREDQAGETAAGIYESELEVAPGELLEACRRVSRSGRAEYFQAFRRSGVQAFRTIDHPKTITRSVGTRPERLNARTPERLNAPEYPADVLVQPMAARAAGGVAWVRALGVDLEIAAGAFDRAVSGAARPTRASLSTMGPPWTAVPRELPAGLTFRRLQAGLWPHLRRAHRLFDTGTLDMEWCYDPQAGFRILQARPIGERGHRPEGVVLARRLLTAANLREVAPPEPSRFLVGTLEAVSFILPRAYARADRGIAGWHEPFTVTVAGRPYINADFYAALMDRWGLPRALVARAMGGSVPARLPQPHRLLASLPALARLAAGWTRLYPDSGATLARLRADLDAARELPELATWFVSAFRAMVESMLQITGALSAAVPLWPGAAPPVVTAAMAAELRAAEADGSAAVWARFAAQWGHRGEYESDPASPRGDELTGMHPRPPLPDPLAMLPGPLRRLPMLAPRHLTAHREWFKDGAMRLWAAFRSRMLAAAAELVRKGLLEQPEQIWQLTPAEIRRVPVGEWRALVACHSQVRPAAVEATLFWSDTLAPLDSPLGEGRLPLVAGRASGPALVARTPSEALVLLERMPAGAGRPILLAPAVDPGWLPVFVRVAGVATELGGRLSHAATLLRELRVPSVLNLPGVMETARTGEVVELRVPPGEVVRLER